ncbi:MAG: HlyD family efflux transporter periplasmic adaptor subunit [Caldilineaceae bacterium SB0665_bin_25]|nr:efflux RND transporter periplasmic adaptor subunit [Caldilineaceae bacterium]MXZ20487.1 HlyD family efflux transporter periplasmic adaptor subunit [Caldilineaceae bacterium SB0665_bin_25]
MNWKHTLIILSAVVVGVAFGVGFAGFSGRIGPEQTAAAMEMAAVAEPAAETEPAVSIETTLIRPADSAVDRVTAAGNIELVDTRQVVARVNGYVDEVPVEVGDVVGSGDLLVALERTDLRRAVDQARINLTSAELQLESLLADASAAELAAASADLKSAEENLAQVQNGASEGELAAARSNAASAWARYDDLRNGASENERIQLAAAMENAHVTMQEAQTEYDKVAWREDVGMTRQAAQLQQATISYGSALAAYEEAVAPASQADLQSALSQAQTAQQQLDDLLAGPTAVNIAAAEAQVAAAQSRLDTLLRGADETDIELAQLAIDQAQLTLLEARLDLVKAELVAPAAGTVLRVNVNESDRISAGTVAITIADLGQLQLTIDVAEVDIPKISVGQLADVTIDAFPERVFAGLISGIEPSSSAQEGVIDYPVTVRLIDEALTGIRPGMTAVAILRSETADARWLVPTTAVQEANGETVVMKSRDEDALPVAVVVEGVQGEWTVVRSTQLQSGDEVFGATTFVKQEDEWVPFSGPPRGAPGAGGGSP